MKRLLYILSFLFSVLTYAQTGQLSGTVTDSIGDPIKNVEVTVYTVNFQSSDRTNKTGYFNIEVPAGEMLTVDFGGNFNYERKTLTILVKADQSKTLNVILGLETENDVVITDKYTHLDKFEPPTPGKIPTTSGNFEDFIKLTRMGVSSSNELSSTYNVRGGNYDENLIYVNGIEIFRPFLTRSGQQEGLSFIHSDLVQNVQFSAGGFDAVYGDKMSSVLDIEYREPKDFGGSFQASLMGVNVHVEDKVNRRLTYLLGTRYRNNSYVLGGLQTSGDYRPVFADAQALLSYKFGEASSVELLTHYSDNKYQVVPQNRETAFGPINEALKFTVYFDGQEVSRFRTLMTALSFNLQATKNTRIKWISSVFGSQEEEKFDIMGQYWLDELETDLGSEEFGETTVNRGVGTFLNHARNRLNSTIYNSYIKAQSNLKKGHKLFYGIKYQHEIFDDRISEWQLLDSAGYALPQSSDHTIELQELLKSRLNLVSNRYSAYIQDSYGFSKARDTIIKDSAFTSYSSFRIVFGGRVQYWDYNEQFLFSPRAKIAYNPHWYYWREDKLLQRDAEIRFSTGVYYQAPFYRELRTFDGMLNPEVRAQRSIHFVLGGYYTFDWWQRPFKLSSEIYYKKLDFINPYEVNNVRIQYHAENKAKGYATGADFMLNGEFIEGIESWAKLSFLKTGEDIENDQYYEYYNSDNEKIIFGYTFNDSIADSVQVKPGNIPRPADQRVTVGLFFQDEMPRWPSVKVQLSILFGTGLPFGPPDHNRYKDVFRSPPYRRVDIGFSKDLLSNKEHLKEGSFLHHIDAMWISLEVFNLLNISNTVSYTWIKDASNLTYPVPNFLTSRRVNLKFVVKF